MCVLKSATNLIRGAPSASQQNWELSQAQSIFLFYVYLRSRVTVVYCHAFACRTIRFLRETKRRGKATRGVYDYGVSCYFFTSSCLSYLRCQRLFMRGFWFRSNALAARSGRQARLPAVVRGRAPESVGNRAWEEDRLEASSPWARKKPLVPKVRFVEG